LSDGSPRRPCRRPSAAPPAGPRAQCPVQPCPFAALRPSPTSPVLAVVVSHLTGAPNRPSRRTARRGRPGPCPPLPTPVALWAAPRRVKGKALAFREAAVGGYVVMFSVVDRLLGGNAPPRRSSKRMMRTARSEESPCGVAS